MATAIEAPRHEHEYESECPEPAQQDRDACGVPAFEVLLSAEAYMPRFGAGKALLVQAGTPCEALVRHGREDVRLSIGAGPTILAAHHKCQADILATRHLQLIEENALACLLAIVDPAIERDDRRAASDHAQADPIAVHCLPPAYAQSSLSIEHWLLFQVMQAEPHPFLDRLRQSESYQLATYLFNNDDTHPHMKMQSRQYGVSYSYFRRLCRRALGGRVKARLRHWRAARSALALVCGDRSVLDVALENGYSCSAHISREIKSIFGITPSRFLRAHALLP